MAALTYMNEEEGRDFIHLVRNNKRLNTLENAYSGAHEKNLAKLVENERFA